MPENAIGTPLLVSGDTSAILSRDSSFDESWLQTLIHRNPACLPMDQIEPGIGRLIPVCMELPLRSGAVDNLLFTPDGNVVIVEVKLWRNPEARRKVVAQALEYATTLFELNYETLEQAFRKAKFDGDTIPERLYDLVGKHDALPEHEFVDRVNRNLAKGRIIVIIVGDGIRTDAEALVVGLQAHANFHFTFALVEMPVYKCDSADAEFIVVPHTLVKTITIPRYTISTEEGSAILIDSGLDDVKSTKPSVRTSISSDDFFEAMTKLSPTLPKELKRFLDDVDAIGVRLEFLNSLNLKWDQPEGKPVNLGYILPTGEIWTDASYWQVENELAEIYNSRLADLFGGKIREGNKGKDGSRNRWVTRKDGKPFRIDNIVDDLPEWTLLIENFQDSIRERARQREA